MTELIEKGHYHCGLLLRVNFSEFRPRLSINCTRVGGAVTPCRSASWDTPIACLVSVGGKKALSNLMLVTLKLWWWLLQRRLAKFQCNIGLCEGQLGLRCRVVLLNSPGG